MRKAGRSGGVDWPCGFSSEFVCCAADELVEDDMARDVALAAKVGVQCSVHELVSVASIGLWQKAAASWRAWEQAS